MNVVSSRQWVLERPEGRECLEWSGGACSTVGEQTLQPIIGRLGGAPDLSNNLPYITRLSSSVDATSVWVVPVAKGGDRIKEVPRK